MSGQREFEDSLQQRIDEYLKSFRSKEDIFEGADTASELADALDYHLLEKAAEELRTARERLDKLQQNLGKK